MSNLSLVIPAVIPAQAGAKLTRHTTYPQRVAIAMSVAWVPAFAGMTAEKPGDEALPALRAVKGCRE